MYDQTGQTGEGNAADYNNYHEGGQGFNPEDIFGQFKGFNQGRGNQNTGGFEDILNDLFGGGFNQRQSKNNPFDNSPISMSVTLSFEESVKGVTKVFLVSFRSSNSKEKLLVLLVTARDQDRGLNLKNADHARALECKALGRACL